MKKKIIAVVILGLIFLCSCSNKENKTAIDNNLAFSNKNEESDNVQRSSETTNPEPEESSRKAYTINSANIYNMKDTVKIDELVITIKDAYYYKTLPESVNQQEMLYLNSDLDENGNLKADTRYVFIEGTVTNSSSDMVTYYLNMADISELDAAGGVTQLTSETRYRADCKPGDLAGKDYFKCDLQPNKTLEFQTIYIIYDGMEEKELYYVINKDGYGPGYDGLKAVKLGQLGERK